VVLTLESSGASIPGVTDVTVTVMKGQTQMKAISYHHAAVTIGQDASTPPVTLSVSFTDSEVGDVSFVVEASASGCAVGSGTTTATIKRGGRADATVSLTALVGCPQPDGGAGDAGAPDAFPGCDPASLTCPSTGGAPAGCHVNCDTHMGECGPAGAGGPGQTCAQNSDCLPGSQCFDYAGTGCAVKVCLPFCDTAAQCPQPGDGGVGPGSMCAGPVQCSDVLTPYHTCTFSCDPRAQAVSGGTSGCPTGLSCLVVGNMDQVDCACPEATRLKQEGADCTSATDCAPGLICNTMSGTQKCRAICRCNATGPSCTSPTNDCPTSGTTCNALTNDTIYGVCL
jgi:hypothetical protein